MTHHTFRSFPVVSFPGAYPSRCLAAFIMAVVSIGMVGCDQVVPEEVDSEFVRVQRTLNDRVDALEEELEWVKAEAAEAMISYQITTNELVNQVRQYRRALLKARSEPKPARTIEETLSVRKVPGEESGESELVRPTLARLEADGGSLSFDSIFDEVEEEEDGGEIEESNEEEMDEIDSECPLLVSGIRFIGRKRLEGRRDSRYWTKAMEVDLENPTDRMMAVQLWAHVPPEMGWYFDDFGPKQVRLGPGQKKQKIVIPYDPAYRLFVLVESNIYPFPLKPDEK